MKAFFSIFLVISAIAGCTKNIPVTPKETNTVSNTDNTGAPAGATMGTTTPNPSARSLTYLALGDSYTIGQSVSQDQSFPYQLTAQLNQQTKVNAPDIVAVTGWTTNNLINGINNSGLTNNTYDFVTLLIGVNDQYQGLSQDSYRARLITLLNTAIKFAKGNKNRVFVISIPDYSVTPYAAGSNTDAIAKEIDQFNAINKAESDKAGANYLNITDISRQAATDGTLLAPDGLHPSGKMYGLWEQLLYPLVKSKL